MTVKIINPESVFPKGLQFKFACSAPRKQAIFLAHIYIYIFPVSENISFLVTYR